MGLARLRAEAGLTREQLAVAAGLSVSTLVRLEAGNTNPHRSTLRLLALELGCDPADLLLADDNGARQSAVVKIAVGASDESSG